MRDEFGDSRRARARVTETRQLAQGPRVAAVACPCQTHVRPGDRAQLVTETAATAAP